jgi:hypothetical protein
MCFVPAKRKVEGFVTFIAPVLQHHAMKTCGGVEVKPRAFLTLALYRGRRSASRSNRIAP